MPKRLLRCQSAAVRYLDFEQISLIHSPFRRAFTIISMNFILAFNTEAKLKTRQLPSKVVHRTRTFPKRKNAVERTDERAAIFVLNARFRLFIHQPYACAVVIQLCPSVRGATPGAGVHEYISCAFVQWPAAVPQLVFC